MNELLVFMCDGAPVRGEIVSIADILDEYGIDEIKPEDAESKNSPAVLGAALTGESESI